MPPRPEHNTTAAASGSQRRTARAPGRSEPRLDVLRRKGRHQPRLDVRRHARTVGIGERTQPGAQRRLPFEATVAVGAGRRVGADLPLDERRRPASRDLQQQIPTLLTGHAQLLVPRSFAGRHSPLDSSGVAASTAGAA